MPICTAIANGFIHTQYNLGSNRFGIRLRWKIFFNRIESEPKVCCLLCKYFFAGNSQDKNLRHRSSRSSAEHGSACHFYKLPERNKASHIHPRWVQKSRVAFCCNSSAGSARSACRSAAFNFTAICSPYFSASCSVRIRNIMDSPEPKTRFLQSRPETGRGRGEK